MNEYRDATDRLSIELSNSDDARLFEGFAENLQKAFKARLLQKLDGLDQRYWDFEIGGAVLVLHSDAMMGISVHIEDGTHDALLRDVASKLSELKR